LLPLFKLGVGGKFGAGDQYMSWVSIHDEVGIICHLLENEISGPVNLTGPTPVTNDQFTKTLGSVLGRPSMLPVPAFGPKLLLGGERADALLFDSMRVLPEVISGSTYSFKHNTLEAALRTILNKPA
jgi:NAD dependent epimerase/dehydratase family enzyme